MTSVWCCYCTIRSFFLLCEVRFSGKIYHLTHVWELFLVLGFSQTSNVTEQNPFSGAMTPSGSHWWALSLSRINDLIFYTLIYFTLLFAFGEQFVLACLDWVRYLYIIYIRVLVCFIYCLPLLSSYSLHCIYYNVLGIW